MDMSNYFELLNIERKYDINLDELDSQYFAMQSKYHPDRSSVNEEKQRNLAISVDLNKAYSMLKDDLTRSEYLLFLNNIILQEVDTEQIMSKEQLNYVWGELELVDNIEELTQLEHILNDKMLEKQKLKEALNISFQNENIQDALDITIKFKYLKNLISNIQQKILAKKSI
jgi:molecular chaperone HscB